MTPRAQKLVDAFNALPTDEQAELLEQLLPANDPVLQADLQHRIGALEDGTAVLIDGREAIARLRAKFLATRS